MGWLKSIIQKTQPDAAGDFMRDFDPVHAKILGVEDPQPQNGGSIQLSGGTFDVAKPPPDPLQTLIQPTAVPSPNSAQAGQARRQSLRKQLERRGRLSTILTQADDTLGA